ncbi:MAG TPA: PilZ domain-containing protein [Terriglobales bacterium]
MNKPSPESTRPPALNPRQHNRRFPRFRAQLNMTVTVLGPDGSFDVHGLCNEISEGGIGCIIGRELSVGELVTLALRFSPADPPTSLRAIVRWRDRLRHGLEFFMPSAEQSAALRAFCTRLSSEPDARV